MLFQRLEALRIGADNTQGDIAEILVCHREVYRRYEKGIREIPVWTATRLAQSCHTSTDYLFGLTDSPTPYSRGRSGSSFKKP